jgi:hypothetical protein
MPQVISQRERQRLAVQGAMAALDLVRDELIAELPDSLSIVIGQSIDRIKFAVQHTAWKFKEDNYKYL